MHYTQPTNLQMIEVVQHQLDFRGTAIPAHRPDELRRSLLSAEMPCDYAALSWHGGDSSFTGHSFGPNLADFGSHSARMLL